MAIEIRIGKNLVAEGDRDETEQFVQGRNDLTMEFTKEWVAAKRMVAEDFVDQYREFLSPYSGTSVTFSDHNLQSKRGTLTGNAIYGARTGSRDIGFYPEILVEGTNEKVFIDPHHIRLVV